MDQGLNRYSVPEFSKVHIMEVGTGFLSIFLEGHQLDEILGVDALGLGQTLVANCQIQWLIQTTFNAILGVNRLMNHLSEPRILSIQSLQALRLTLSLNRSPKIPVACKLGMAWKLSSSKALSPSGSCWPVV